MFTEVREFLPEKQHYDKLSIDRSHWIAPPTVARNNRHAVPFPSFQFLRRIRDQVIPPGGVNASFHGVGVPKATKMKNPRRFSRLVDLRPVEPSRGPSLVKVNTSSRQCISVRAPTSLDPPVHSTLFTRPSNSPSFSVAPAESRQRSPLPFYLSFFFPPPKDDTLIISPIPGLNKYLRFPGSVFIESTNHAQSSPQRRAGSRVELTFVWQMRLLGPWKACSMYARSQAVVDIHHRVPVIEIIHPGRPATLTLLLDESAGIGVSHRSPGGKTSPRNYRLRCRGAAVLSRLVYFSPP